MRGTLMFPLVLFMCFKPRNVTSNPLRKKKVSTENVPLAIAIIDASDLISRTMCDALSEKVWKTSK